jgi:hypothetical protein
MRSWGGFPAHPDSSIAAPQAASDINVAARSIRLRQLAVTANLRVSDRKKGSSYMPVCCGMPEHDDRINAHFPEIQGFGPAYFPADRDLDKTSAFLQAWIKPTRFAG